MLNHLTDFSDKLSPMLVKELRQGMRARGFTMLFLVFQCVLALILLSAGASFSSDGAGTFASGVIFTMFSIAVLVIQPMRGTNALSSEITGNTIEMMVLTRLGAWRIVFGKWIAIVSQSALILTTIIPYLILRYFFGGMVLLGELVFLALIFLTSMSLTAIMVGFSATTTKLIRVLPIFGIIFLINTVPRFLFRGGFNMEMSFFTLSDWQSRISILAYVVFIAYLGWCALSNGTSSIAPVSENHSTIRRLIALGLTCIGVAIGFHKAVDPELLTLMFGIILAPAVVIALTEPAVLVRPIYQPFKQRGLPGRLASVVLLPGWPAGVFFTAMLVALSFAGIAICSSNHTSTFDREVVIVSLALLGGVLLPALCSANFTKQENKRFTNFMIFLLFSILLTILPMILTSIKNQENLLWFFIWNPPVGLFMLSNSRFDQDALLTALTIVDLVILALLLITATFGFGRYFKTMEESEMIATKPAPNP